VPQTPILAASAVIVDGANRVLLVKRGHEPAKGLWSLPGGSVEEGETLGQAATREVREETGLHVVTGSEVWRVLVELSEGSHYDVRALSATVTGGQLVAGDDAADARWWHQAELADVDLTPKLFEFLTDYLG
jgi:acetyl-CoA carboxylase carboxyl transferase subunit beta